MWQQRNNRQLDSTNKDKLNFPSMESVQIKKNT